MRGDPRRALDDLARLPGVRAAVLTSEHDGLAAASIAVVDVDAEALAAFAMSLARRARLANQAAGFGPTRLLTLEAEHGRLLVAASDDTAVVVLSDPEAGTGLLRVTLQRVMRELA